MSDFFTILFGHPAPRGASATDKIESEESREGLAKKKRQGGVSSPRRAARDERAAGFYEWLQRRGEDTAPYRIGCAR